MDRIDFDDIKREDFILDHKGNLYLVLMPNEEFEDMFKLCDYILGYNIVKDRVQKLENDCAYSLVDRKNKHYVGRLKSLWSEVIKL